MKTGKTSSPQIIFENENLLVINKPSGLTVNKSETTKYQDTLQEWVEKELRIKNQESRDGGEFYQRAGIVHRLDKDTSGLILVAKNPASFLNLQLQFKNRSVKKNYLALVWGKLTGNGSINAPITRNPFNRSRFGVFVGGREAHTDYQILNNIRLESHDFTLLKVSPITGRTHQIRVHLNYLNHPIVGDKLYSGQKLTKLGLAIFHRLMLHAYQISFNDPTTNKRLEFASQVPEQFQICLPAK